jgi:hypothetical protein
MGLRKKANKKKGPGDDLIKKGSSSEPKKPNLRLGSQEKSSSYSKTPNLYLEGQLGGSKKGYGGGIGGSLDVPILNRKKTSVGLTTDFVVSGYKNKGGSSGYYADILPGVRITRTIGKKKKK